MPIIKMRLLYPLLLLAASVHAEVRVRATVEPAQIRIGDRFLYRITVEHDTGWQADLPGLVGNLGAFEVKEMQVEEGKVQGGRTSRSWEATLSTIISGDFLLPPQQVLARRGDDTTQLQTEALQVRVLAATTGEETDIDDIESPLGDPRLAPWVWWALGLAGMVILGGLWWWRRRRRASAPVPELPPYEQALAALAPLKEPEHHQPESQSAFFFELSFILRRYLERRFAIEALDATSPELLARTRALPAFTPHQREHLGLFTRSSDLVKFARQPLPEQECLQWHAFVVDLVEQTRPREEDTAATTPQGTPIPAPIQPTQSTQVSPTPISAPQTPAPTPAAQEPAQPSAADPAPQEKPPREDA